MRYAIKLFKPGALRPYFIGFLDRAIGVPEDSPNTEAAWVCQIEQALNHSTLGRCHITESTDDIAED